MHVASQIKVHRHVSPLHWAARGALALFFFAVGAYAADTHEDVTDAASSADTSTWTTAPEDESRELGRQRLDDGGSLLSEERQGLDDDVESRGLALSRQCSGGDCVVISSSAEVQVVGESPFDLDIVPYLCKDTPDGDCSATHGEIVGEYDSRALVLHTPLHLTSMDLTGTIPVALGLLTDITSIDLSLNSVAGAIPEVVGFLTKVRNVKMAYNHLQGSIPMAFGLMTELANFDLSVNQLSGSIPIIFGQFPSLVSINLGSNKLQGSIPDAMFVPWVLLWDFFDEDEENSELARLQHIMPQLGGPGDLAALDGGCSDPPCQAPALAAHAKDAEQTHAAEQQQQQQQVEDEDAGNCSADGSCTDA